jgi:multidrug efflux pump subunit AcrB
VSRADPGLSAPPVTISNRQLVQCSHAGIVNATTVSPKGTIDGKTRTFTIYDNGQMLNAAPWNDVVVAYKNGAPVRIRDIGRAIDALENIRLAAFADGKQASCVFVGCER